MAFTPTHRPLPARYPAREGDGDQHQDQDTAPQDLWRYRVFRWLRSLSWVMLWFFWVGFLDLLSGRWVNMGITVAAGTVGLLLRMGLGWLNGEPREDWFTDLPVVLLRILLCVLRPHRACAALGMPTGEEDARAVVRNLAHPDRRARHIDRRHHRYRRRSASRSPMGRYGNR